MAATFDLLRGKVETEVSHPSVVAITSATNEDGREVAARGLAESLAATGYSTLLIEVVGEGIGSQYTSEAFALNEVSRGAMPSQATSKLVVVTVVASDDRKINAWRIRAAFEAFRQTFDYTVISADFRGSPQPFIATVASVANAILVSVRTGRRQTRDDSRLASELKRFGRRFLGLIPITNTTSNKAAESRLPLKPIDKAMSCDDRHQCQAHEILQLALRLHRLRPNGMQLRQISREGGHFMLKVEAQV